MLILAGVSLNAIIGDNGLITQTQYASFLQEMTAVQEAVDTWKAGRTIDNAGELTNKIPVTRMVTQAELTNSSRLTGEVGYYRVWSLTGKRPTQSVSLSVSEFDNEFSGEIIAYPAGIQDLYVLNNEILDLDEDKVYYIDAVNSMIYSANGFAISELSAHSLNMLNAIMNGSEKKPKFASAEVSGGGSTGSQILAGNTAPEYLMNENGEYVDEDGEVVTEANKVKNPNYNPNGFQIYSDYRTSNLYKLYNNGDLYGKGVKGPQLNTSDEEMEELDVTKFVEFSIPSQIKGCKKTILGIGTVYFIDKNDDLWAIGNNSYNKLCLSEEQQVEYTGREAVKLNVNNKKVDMCWDLDGRILYVRTLDNKLYAYSEDRNVCKSYFFANNSQELVTEFTEINFEKVDKIDYMIVCWSGGQSGGVTIACTDKTFYSVGKLVGKFGGTTGNSTYTYFCPVFNGYCYKWSDTRKCYEAGEYNSKYDIDEHISKIIRYDGTGLMILKDDHTVFVTSSGQGNNINVTFETGENIAKLSVGTDESGVKDIVSACGGYVVLKENGDLYGYGGLNNGLGINKEGNWNGEKITKLPTSLVKDGLKEIYGTSGGIYYLSNKNELYGSSYSATYLENKDYVEEDGIVKINVNFPINSFSDGCFDVFKNYSNLAILSSSNGKLYCIGNRTLMHRDNVLQKNWIKITDMKVSKVKVGENSSLAIVDYNKNLYVRGNNGSILGININDNSSVDTLTKVDDDRINGKVKDVNFTNCTMNVLTTTGELYVTGKFSTDGKSQSWPNGGYPGWSEKINNYNLVKINIDNVIVDGKKVDNVTMVNSVEKDQVAISHGKIYTWGCNYYNAYYNGSLTPIVSQFNNIVNGSNVKQIFISRPASFVLMNDGKLYLDGGDYGEYYSYTGIGTGNNTLKDITTSFEGNTIKSFACSLSVAMFLTNTGKVYGYGYKNQLGIGNANKIVTNEMQSFNIGNGEKVTQITVGDGYAIAITETGKVYGTGTNSNGVLGRWIGIDRNSPNSRYKTAFDWVECPELEI